MQQDPIPEINRLAGEQCSRCQPLLVLCAAGDELDPVQQSDLSLHLAQCVSCSMALGREENLLVLLSAHRLEPDVAFLSGCRAHLEDALDREEEGGWFRRRVGAFLPSSWVSPQPVWSAALLVMIGFSVGILGPRFLQHPIKIAPHVATTLDPVPVSNSIGRDPAIRTSPSALSRIDLHTADVAGINVFPAAGSDPPQVELQMKAQEPVTVQGTVDDDNVKRVLLYILRNNARFDPDVRLNAVDLLRERKDDPEVRSALCEAVRTDENAAVRLKAIEAINGAEPQTLIRNTLLDALVSDQNPGVRVEAISSLREMVEKGALTSDDHLLAVLRDRMQHDPNNYVRLQSAATLRTVGPNEK